MRKQDRIYLDTVLATFTNPIAMYQYTIHFTLCCYRDKIESRAVLDRIQWTFPSWLHIVATKEVGINLQQEAINNAFDLFHCHDVVMSFCNLARAISSLQIMIPSLFGWWKVSFLLLLKRRCTRLFGLAARWRWLPTVVVMADRARRVKAEDERNMMIKYRYCRPVWIKDETMKIVRQNCESCFLPMIFLGHTSLRRFLVQWILDLYCFRTKVSVQRTDSLRRFWWVASNPPSICWISFSVARRFQLIENVTWSSSLW